MTAASLRGLGPSSVLLVLFYTGVTCTGKQDFTKVTTCTCFGSNEYALFECTIRGDGPSIWSLTVCADGMMTPCIEENITLAHSASFTQSNGSRPQAGGITVRGIAAHDNAYTSQLNVTLRLSRLGGTVECSNSTDIIGNYTLLDQSRIGPFPPPNASTIILNEIGPNLISFTWTNVEGHDGCPSLRYIVDTTNCGTCSPNVTTSTAATCTNFRSILLEESDNSCNFTLQSEICNPGFPGEVSYKNITLKVPDPPDIQVIPVYDNKTSSVIQLVTSFRTVDSFKISDDNPVVDGSATSYNITYSIDSATDVTYHSATIMASSCFNGNCNHTFDCSNCPSSASVRVTASATNMLGTGRSSATIERDCLNRFVNVTFCPMTKIVQCTFLGEAATSDTSRECNATVYYGDNCDQRVGVYPSGISSNITLNTTQIEIRGGTSLEKYCFNVTARSGDLTVMVRANISSGERNHSRPIVLVTSLVIAAITMLLLTLAM